MKLYTDKRFKTCEEDDYCIETKQLQQNSNIWKLKLNNDVIVMCDNKLFCGNVVGFNTTGQKGRTIYIQTGKNEMIFLDAFLHHCVIYKKVI